MTFDEAGYACIRDAYRVTYEDYQSQQAYIQELKDQYGDNWSDYWWDGEIYTTCTIDGVEYYLSGQGRSYDCKYSEKDGKVILGNASVYEFGLLARTAGNQLTATVGSYEIGGNGAVYTWSAS